MIGNLNIASLPLHIHTVRVPNLDEMGTGSNRIPIGSTNQPIEMHHGSSTEWDSCH